MGKNQLLDIHIFANAALGPYISGGDRIFIECAKRWKACGHDVTVYVWEEGRAMCERNGLSGVRFVVLPALQYKRFGFGICYFFRFLNGVRYALSLKPRRAERPTVVYSASDFWPDSFPAYLLSRKIRGSVWAAGFYLFAPSPWKGFRQGTRKGAHLPGIREVLYGMHQAPVYWLVKNRSHLICVTGDEDKGRFISAGRREDEIFVVRGGVDAKAAQAILAGGAKRSGEYTACFVGRLHPQKGVLELIRIWELVVRRLPQARLALIGEDSPAYKQQVISEISRLGLEGSIDMLGFLDGNGKYDIFMKSLMILHPAVYDSGGMAACEAMAFGLPAVSFDLPALRSYYPKGMLKTRCFDLGEFAGNIVGLATDQALYQKTRTDALSWAMEWDWDARAGALAQAFISRSS